VLSVLQVLLAAVLFGTTGASQALGPAATTPLGVGAIRLVVGGFGLLAVLPLVGEQVRDAVGLWRTARGVVSGVCTAGYQICFFAAVAQTGVAVGTVIAIGSGPVFAGLLGRLMLREYPSRAWFAAASLSACGLAMLSFGELANAEADPLGIVLALGSGLGYALYTVLSRSLIQDGAPSEAVMAASFGLGGVLMLPVLVVEPLEWVSTPGGAILAICLGLGTTTLAYVLYGRGLAVLPAAAVTTLVLAEPLVATGLGVLVLGEVLSLPEMAGVTMISAGLVTQGVGAARVSPVGRSGLDASIQPSPAQRKAFDSRG
jgi:DME family drug/metabolite transporter